MSEDVNEIVVEEPYGFIYISTNMCNGKRYLGRRKFSEDWEYYLGSGAIFKKAIKKYGRENFVRNIIDIAYSEDELNQKEYEYSVFLNIVDSDDWYNLVYGGGTTTGYHMSDETKKKQSDKAKERFSNKENHPMYGKPGLSGEKNSQYGVSPKERMDEEIYNQWYEKHKTYWENLSQEMKGKHIWGEDNPHPNLGKHLSDETKQKISNARKGKYAGENSPWYGRHHTEESKKKIIENRKIISGIDHYNSLQVLCIETNIPFGSISETSKITGIRKSYISEVCRGERENAKGYHFKYISKEEYKTLKEKGD